MSAFFQWSRPITPAPTKAALTGRAGLAAAVAAAGAGASVVTRDCRLLARGMAVLKTTWERVLARRLERHFLARSRAKSATDVAARLGGVHAQVMSSAELAIALRAPSVSAEDVRVALEKEKSLVKTWAARGTLHLLPTDELPEWVAAMSLRRNHTKGAWYRYFKMTAADVEALFDALPNVLGRRRLTREALASGVARATKRPHLEERVLGSWGAV